MNVEKLGKVELRALCKEYGIKNYGKMDNAGMRAAILAKDIDREIQAEVNSKPIPVKTVIKAPKLLAGTYTAQVEKVKVKDNVVTVTAKVKATIQNGIRKPLKAGLTKQAWEIYDALASDKGIESVSLKDALSATSKANLNPAMSRTQYYWWRTFNGLGKANVRLN